ncbi:hypothetical protein FEMY_23010 [Ferrovum myxofaciens]|uniref:GTPase n=2 Tax=Ferrovum myxofaciens TaxID=416213 RepID=A0A149VVC3_9PROT|nr:hypothetical protein FEMY_23010 [Ferrovum myxofaciens]
MRKNYPGKYNAAGLPLTPERDTFLDVLCRFEDVVDAVEVVLSANASASIRDATNAFRTRYDALRSTLDGLVERTAANLSAAYSDIERDSDLVTIMLFGRTRAGKSTTMEALTGWGGASIGIGRQHTTGQSLGRERDG